MLIPVILAGGVGSRLWPLSRESHPKQFIHLFTGQSLFQKTLDRSLTLPNVAPIIVGSEEHRFIIAEQIREMSLKGMPILLEPMMRSTAPAVAFAAFCALEKDDQAILLVLPGDHDISDGAGFKRTVMQGLKGAELGKLVTFGVTPTSPETGYGYIEKGRTFKDNISVVERFVEKPNLDKAVQFIRSQKYFWNSGMFLFQAKVYLQQLQQFAPKIYQATKQAFEKRTADIDFIRPGEQAFADNPSDSVDYAVMEKTRDAVVIPLESEWKDIGAWDALAQMYTQDEHGNATSGDVIAMESKNCLLKSKHRLVAAVGVENLIIVETPDVVLVLNKAHSQAVKNVVTYLKQHGRKEVSQHRRTHRPWGSFESIDQGERFQVKRITVNIGEQLSLQRHHHRSEHWVVVKGTAQVTRGEETFLLSENQSTYIPIGVIHRLKNIGKIPLEIIEIQSGAYLGEDDIERLDDQYGREPTSSQAPETCDVS